jgi:hypothetical protein
MAGQQAADRDFHATYSGSGIHRLLAGCYGAVRLARTVPPPPPTKWQEEGTAAHAELEAFVTKSEPAPQASVRTAIDYVHSLRPLWVWSEQRVIFPQSIVPPMECSGTLDVLVLAGRRAWVIDYKHGAGEFVAVEENAQLMFYAWAALHDKMPEMDEITLTIIQPNTSYGEPIREYRTSAAELLEFAIQVRHAIEQAERLHAPLLPGEHCKFCPAGPVCDARERSALAVMSGGAADKVRDWQPADLPKPDALDVARLGEIVTKAPAIRAWLKTVEDYAEARAVAGEIVVPGCKVVEAPARRKWDGGEHEIAEHLAEAVVEQGGNPLAVLDRVFPRKLIGITEAEKLVIEAATRGIDDLGERRAAIAKAKEAFSALTVKESSGALSLVPLSDPRPPVNRADKHFGGVTVKGLES